MPDLTSLIAFGVWPALPLTGHYLLTRTYRRSGPPPFPLGTWFALTSAVGIAVWSVPMLVSAQFGVYRGAYFGVLGWGIVMFGLKALPRRREGPFPSWASLGLWDWVLVVGLLVAAILYLGFPHDSATNPADDAIYAHHAIYISRHGRLTVPYPWTEDAGSIFSQLFSDSLEVYPMTYQTTKFPWYALDRHAMTVAFAHLFKIWLAQMFTTVGHVGLLRLNGAFALLFLGIFYGLCRTVTPKPFAVVATLFMALNPAEIWLARVTLTEILAQLLIWSGVLCLATALRTDDTWLMGWAGILLGSSALVRIDSFLLLPALLLSHFAHSVFTHPTAETTPTFWRPLYSTAVPAFAMALLVHTTSSTPYTVNFYSHFVKIGLATALSAAALLATSSGRSRLVHHWLTGKPALWLAGWLALALLVYGWWIRPSRTPSFRAYSLVNLSRHLSTPVVWTAMLGWYVSLWSAARKGTGHYLAPALVVVASFSALYLWDPRAQPVYFWAVRRFVPVIIPGAVFFGSIGVGWALANSPPRWNATLSQLVLLFLLVFTIRANTPLLLFAENSGSFSQLAELAGKLPRNEVIPACGHSKWITPLYLSFDRKVVPLNLATEKGRDVFERWFEKRAGDRKPVYLLCERRAIPAGMNTQPLADIVLRRAYRQETPEPLPKTIVSEQTLVTLYRVTGVSGRSDYQNTALGARPVWGVKESGFHHQEWADGRPVRWTNGMAALHIPLDARRPPKALRVRLEAARPGGALLRVLANGRQVVGERVSERGWDRTFSLSDTPRGKEIAIELTSDTFIPSKVTRGSLDRRTLGVFVVGIWLLQHNQPISGEPLSRTGYRSRLALAGKAEGLTATWREPSTVRVAVQNLGREPWPTLTDLQRETGSVRIGVLWFAPGALHTRLAEHRAELPYTVYPGDDVEIDVPLTPIGYNAKPLPAGSYEVWIGPVQEHITWFYDKGDEVLKLAVVVRP